MESFGQSNIHSNPDDDNDVTFMNVNNLIALQESSFSPHRNLQAVSSASEELTKLRRDNFNLRLLCHNYKQVYENGLMDDPVMRITDLESENSQLSEQLNEKSSLLNRASKLLASLKSENENLRFNLENWATKYESSEREWKQKYDILAGELQTHRSSQRQAESKCEIIENESFQRETAQKAEMSVLQKQLIAADSTIAILEAELSSLSRTSMVIAENKVSLSVQEKENTPIRPLSRLSPGPSPNDASISSGANKSINGSEYSKLLNRHNAARLMIEDLTNKNMALSRELELCGEKNAALDAKVHMLMDQIAEERKSHYIDLENHKKVEQSLHDRIANLINDRGFQMKRCDSLLDEVNQLKEFNARIRRKHTHQLDTLDKMLRDRETTIYELTTMNNANPEKPGDDVRSTSEDRNDASVKAPGECIPFDETTPLGEVTQIIHSDCSSIFNATAEMPQNPHSGEVARLQRELVNIRSKLVDQVKTNTRLKTAYNALSHSVVQRPINLSQSLNRSAGEGSTNHGRLRSKTFTFDGDSNSMLRIPEECEVYESLDNAPAGILERTAHVLHVTLDRLESEISIMEVSEAAVSVQIGSAVDQINQLAIEEPGDPALTHPPLPKSSESLDKLKQLHAVIKGLLSQFDNIRTLQRSVKETVNRSLMVSISTNGEACDPPKKNWSFTCDGNNPNAGTAFTTGELSAIWPAERDCEAHKREASIDEDDPPTQSALLSQHAEPLSTSNDTTIAQLQQPRCGTPAEETEDAFDLSALSAAGHSFVSCYGDVSRVELRNRNFFDCVSLAFAKMQCVVDQCSVKAALEILSALQDNDDDTTDYLHRLEKNLSSVTLNRTQSSLSSSEHPKSDRCETTSKVTSETGDTLVDLPRPQTEFPEVAEQGNLRNGRFDFPFGEGDTHTADGLLNRFIKVMVRVNSLSANAEEGVNNSDTGDRKRIPSPEVFSAWSEKAHDWLVQFIEALRGSSSFPALTFSLEVLEHEFDATLSQIADQCVVKCICSREPSISLSQHEAIVATIEDRCKTLATTNDELQRTYVQISEELESAYRKHAESVTYLQSTTVSKWDYDELLDKMTQSQNDALVLQASLLKTQNQVIAVRTQLEESQITIHDLQERLSAAETALTRQLNDLREVASRSSAVAQRLTGAENRVANDVAQMSTKCLTAVALEQETAALTFVEVFESLLSDFASAESKLAALESQKNVEARVEVTRLTEAFEAQLADQQLRLNEKISAYEEAIQDVEGRYSALLEVAEAKHAAAEHLCNKFLAREQQLSEEVELKDVKILGLESDLKAVRMTAAETQVELESLNRRMVEREERDKTQASASDVEEKARKYPELKAIALHLKSRLVKRAELLDQSMKESKRLRGIISDNNKRAKGFVEELERLRNQIVEKNAAIKKLEALARRFSTRPPQEAAYHTRDRSTLLAPSRGEPSPRENQRANLSSPEFQLHPVDVTTPRPSSPRRGGVSRGGQLSIATATPTQNATRSLCYSAKISAPRAGDARSPAAAAAAQIPSTPHQQIASRPPSRSDHSLPICVDGVSTLVTNITATVLELSNCFEAHRNASFAESGDTTNSLNACDGELYTHNTTTFVTSEDSSVSISASSLSRQSSCRSVRTRRSGSSAPIMKLSAKPPTQNVLVIGDLQQHIARCTGQLLGFCSTLVKELQKLSSRSTKTCTVECTSPQHQQAKVILSRLLNHISASLKEKVDEQIILSDVFKYLRQALHLLSGVHSTPSSPLEHRSNSMSPHQRRHPATGSPRTDGTSISPKVTTCSCSCDNRCSQIAGEVQGITEILTNVAAVLSSSPSSQLSNEL